MDKIEFTHFQQKNGYGCGLFAIANTLRNSSVITMERLEISKHGNNIGQLSKWMQEDGHDLFVDPLFFDVTDENIPDHICEITPSIESEEIVSMPILLNVQQKEGGKYHLIAGDLFSNGMLVLFDSLKEQADFITLERSKEMYHKVFGLFCFRGLYDGNYLMRE